MREQSLLAHQRAGSPRGPRAHDGTITTSRVDEMWGTDMTAVVTGKRTPRFRGAKSIAKPRVGSTPAALQTLRKRSARRADKSAAVVGRQHSRLSTFLGETWWHASGVRIALARLAINSGDGATTDAGLRPFSVSHVAQPWRTAREPGDLVIRWVRRSRALAAESWTAPEVPLAEESEAYEVEVLDGSTVKRTIATNTTSVTYTAAQQIADRGALLGPGDTLDIRIFQLSELVGRGAPKAAALQF